MHYTVEDVEDMTKQDFLDAALEGVTRLPRALLLDSALRSIMWI